MQAGGDHLAVRQRYSGTVASQPFVQQLSPLPGGQAHFLPTSASRRNWPPGLPRKRASGRRPCKLGAVGLVRVRAGLSRQGSQPCPATQDRAMLHQLSRTLLPPQHQPQ